jgi:hypothetical protein
VRCAARAALAGPGELAQRLPAAAVGHASGHDRLGDPAAAQRVLLPGAAAEPSQPGGVGADHGRGFRLRPRGVDPPAREARCHAWDHVAFRVAGIRDVQEPGRPGRAVPQPAAERRAVHVRRRGRPGRRRSARAAGPSGSMRSSRPASTPRATARSSDWTSPPPRTAQGGWRSCAG